MFKSHSEKTILRNNIFIEKPPPKEEEELGPEYEGAEFEDDEDALKAALEEEVKMANSSKNWNRNNP